MKDHKYEEKNEMNTDILQKKFAEEDDLEVFLRENVDYFTDGVLNKALLQYLDRSGKKIKDLIDHVYIESSYLYQIFRGSREPSRNKLIQILLFFELPLDEFNRVLKIAGHSPLYIKNKRDVLIIHGINHNMNLYEIDEALCDKDMESLE